MTPVAATAAQRELPRARAYVPELDGIRGVAIGGVMALHFVGGLTATNAVERAAIKISSYGLWGVDLFFVLSGFLITGILVQTKGSPRYLRNFYVRRTLRIFPLYYGVLLLLFVLIPSEVLRSLDPQLIEMRRAQGWIWPYLTNVYLGPQTTFSIPYVSHFWTLAIEEHFYLVWPVLILVLSRTAAMRLCVAVGVGALGLRIGFSIAMPDALYADVLTPCRLDTLCAGSWFALAAGTKRAPAYASALRWLGVLAVAILAISAWHVMRQSEDAVMLPVRTTLLALFFGVFIYLVSQFPNLSAARAALRARWLRGLGKYSYGLYVYHGLVSYALVRFPPDRVLVDALNSHLAASVVQVTFGVAVSLALSVASYQWFEVRFLALKARFECAEADEGVRTRAPEPAAQLADRLDAPETAPPARPPVKSPMPAPSSEMAELASRTL